MTCRKLVGQMCLGAFNNRESMTNVGHRKNKSDFLCVKTASPSLDDILDIFTDADVKIWQLELERLQQHQKIHVWSSQHYKLLFFKITLQENNAQ